MGLFSDLIGQYAVRAPKGSRKKSIHSHPEWQRSVVPMALQIMAAGGVPMRNDLVDRSPLAVDYSIVNGIRNGARKTLGDALGDASDGLGLFREGTGIVRCKENLTLMLKPWENDDATTLAILNEAGLSPEDYRTMVESLSSITG